MKVVYDRIGIKLYKSIAFKDACHAVKFRRYCASVRIQSDVFKGSVLVYFKFSFFTSANVLKLERTKRIKNILYKCYICYHHRHKAILFSFIKMATFEDINCVNNNYLM